MISLMHEQYSIRSLFYHCREFIRNNDLITCDRFLFRMLQENFWILESVSFMLHLHESSNFPIQNLDGCLHLALEGKFNHAAEAHVQALTLLIKAGADVYAKNRHGFTVSEYACMSSEEFNDAPSDLINPHRYKGSRDLRGRWVEALNACGYDAEEVISRSVRVEEISDSESDDDENEDKDDGVSLFTDNDFSAIMDSDDLDLYD